ncbi:hypothetical protein R1sor_016619 [Riccia sorocarpa]|uniref:Uncharacterized protein n=1 Tax=Riccia sorocarpa TaxID=122646 RepID=A0ABD3HJ36_9MARC
MYPGRVLGVKTSYVIEPPYPGLLTTTQLYNLDCYPKEFRTSDITEHFGSVGVINRSWSSERIDWFVTGIQFATLRRLERGHSKHCGPFKVNRREGVFVILETVDGLEFCHLVFLKKTSDHSTTYMPTAALVWSRECLCLKNEDELIDDYCFCTAILQRQFCLVCPSVHLRVTARQAVAEEAAVDTGMISIKSSSVRMLKQEIRKAIGWLEDGPLGGSICIKSLRDKGLHTIVGIIGYCLKDEKEEHFRMFQKNVTDRQMEEGRRMHGIYGASEFKNRLQLTPMNVLTCALQFRKYRAKSPVSTSFRKCLRQMIHSGQYIPALKWTSMPTLSPHKTIKRTEKLWTACVSPETITMNDIDEIFFGYRRKPRYWNFSHPTEHMIADVRSGRKTGDDDSDDELMRELDGDDSDSDAPEDQRTYYRSLYDTLHQTPSPHPREYAANPNLNVECLISTV